VSHDPTQKLLIPVRQSEAGGVVVDLRGRNVWQWKDEQLDSTSVVLQRLENDALELEPSRKVKKVGPGKESSRSGDARGSRDTKRSSDAPSKRRPEPGLNFTTEVGGRDEGGGFDPYNNR
jgi:hypothetical protein